MRYGLLADVHANLHALEAVLGALEKAGVDRYLCAGDIVGYGPMPNECAERVAALDAITVAGNHDLIAIGALSPTRCEQLARSSLEWTRTELNQAARTYLSSLPRTEAVEDIAICHGTLDDPSAYVWTTDEAMTQADALGEVMPRARTLLFGHTHISCLYRQGWSRLETVRKAGTSDLEGDAPTLINPGSVGQSREREAWARCALLDTAARSVTFFAVGYDLAAVRQELERRGRPPGSCHMPPSTRQVVRNVVRRALRR